ncbi:hypothetical protein AB0I10_24560 [Streptomyces sp. NPDC050636]|uniref:hypothetical protein n=1 Tax=Streptomyces sp. NPDC050636 TaxID=3154510 RepID=UPI003415A7B0
MEQGSRPVAHVVWARPDAAAEARVVEVPAGVERAVGGAPCEHARHPGVEDEEWRRSRHEGRFNREIRACPRKIAGFARAVSR